MSENETEAKRPALGGDAVSATLHMVGVNMGDHGETVIRAVEVAEDETVGALLERLIPAPSLWRNREYDNFISLRFVEAAAEPPPPITYRPSTEAPF